MPATRKHSRDIQDDRAHEHHITSPRQLYEYLHMLTRKYELVMGCYIALRYKHYEIFMRCLETIPTFNGINWDTMIISFITHSNHAAVLIAVLEKMSNHLSTNQIDSVITRVIKSIYQQTSDQQWILSNFTAIRIYLGILCKYTTQSTIDYWLSFINPNNSLALALRTVDRGDILEQLYQFPTSSEDLPPTIERDKSPREEPAFPIRVYAMTGNICAIESIINRARVEYENLVARSIIRAKCHISEHDFMRALRSIPDVAHIDWARIIPMIAEAAQPMRNEYLRVCARFIQDTYSHEAQTQIIMAIIGTAQDIAQDSRYETYVPYFTRAMYPEIMSIPSDVLMYLEPFAQTFARMMTMDAREYA